MGGMKLEVLFAYRELLKAARKTFGGNKEYLTESIAEVRKKFDQNKDVTDEQDLKKMISNAYKASHFLTDVLSKPDPNRRNKTKPKGEPETEEEKVDIPTGEILEKL